MEVSVADRPPSGKIRRGHSGCKACRRRGKRCDEAKPVCRACHRLSLACEYGLEISFRNSDAGQIRSLYRGNTSAPLSVDVSETTPKINGSHPECGSNFPRTRSMTFAPVPPLAEEDNTGVYFKHFEYHVRHVLPGAFQGLDKRLSSASLRYAVLCLSASNLAVLDGRIQSRHNPRDNRRSVFSPITNKVHLDQARKYHDLAVAYNQLQRIPNDPADMTVALIAKVLLAIYHHASTNHQAFRLAVEDAQQFVQRHRAAFLKSPDGHRALQMWHHLSLSSRASRRPALFIEGEDDEDLSAKSASPSGMDQLDLICILGLNSDDLILDILVKTIELRKRAIVFRTIARIYNMSDQSQGLGRLAYQHMDSLLNRCSRAEEYEEAEAGFVRGPHLIGLLQIQQDRLSVWKSRFGMDQLPPQLWDCEKAPRDGCSGTSCTNWPALLSHRDAMNALYYLLCRLMIATLQADELLQDPTARTCHSDICIAQNMSKTMLMILNDMHLPTSNTSGVYTFSLGEVLLHLTLTWQSAYTFHHILDVIWPRLEAGTRGFEHSHCPTHLLKRIIALSAEE